MSRRHNFKVEGEGIVKMVCEECGKTQDVRVFFDDEDPCLVDRVIENTTYTWQYADDSVVCSDECYKKFWEYIDYV